jgi:oxygen-independent coproporphyrinogen III oxidase
MYSLYIHIPFCKRKSYYCDFASYHGSENLLPDYLSSLTKEMERHYKMPISTIYIGGGTPSILSSQQLTYLMSEIRRIFSLRTLSEVTIEVNPESLTDEKIRVLKTAGINRVSIGLQSFDDTNLQFLGRLHSLTHFLERYNSLRQFEIYNINVDLMYGLPGQTILEWQRSLGDLVKLNPEHISLYPLTIEEGTHFFDKKVEIDDKIQAEIYDWSIDYLQGHGYNHYEISNWAKIGYKSRHNMTYWTNKEYLGVGVSAASYLNGYRYKNTSDIQEYITMISIGASAVEEKEKIDSQKRLSEEIILNLRCTAGVVLSDDINSKYPDEIKKLLNRKLIEVEGSSLKLTRKGLLFANQVMKEFV